MSFNPERINIKDLTIEEPENYEDSFDLAFDFEGRITDEDWRSIKQDLEDSREKYLNKKDDIKYASGIERTLEYLAILRQLGSHQKLTDSEHQIIEARMANRKEKGEQGHYLIYLKMAADLKLLGETIQISEKEWEIIEGLVRTQIKWSEYRDYSSPVAMTILGRDPNLTKEEIDYFQNGLKEVRGKVKRAPNDMSFGGPLSVRLAEARILGIDYELSQEDWKQMKQEFDNYRNYEHFQWEGLAQKAWGAMVLSANKISIPEGGGLDVVISKKERKVKDKLVPEKRNF